MGAWVKQGTLRVVIGPAWVVIGGGPVATPAGADFDPGARVYDIPEPAMTYNIPEAVMTYDISSVHEYLVREDVDGGD